MESRAGAGVAGCILAFVAGAGLVGAAILLPPILIGLLAWLAHRGWVRGRRKRILDCGDCPATAYRVSG